MPKNIHGQSGSSDRNTSAWKTKFKDVKNIAKNIGAMTLGELAPGIKETTMSTQDALRDTRDFISKAKNQINYQSKSLEGNTAGRKALNIIQNAFDDLKSGSFGIDKMSDAEFDMADEFDSNIRDYDSQITSTTDPEEVSMIESKKNTALLGKAISQGNASTIESFSRMTKTLSNVTLKASQAQTAQLSNVMLATMNSQNANMGMMNTKLSAINANLVNIIEYNNTAQAEFYQKTAEYQSNMLSMMNSFGESIAKMTDIAERKDKQIFRFYFSSGFNVSSYIKMVKKNIGESGIGMLGEMAGMAGGLGANPISMLMPMAFAALIPGKIKNPIKKVDKAFTKSIEEILYRIGDLQYGTSMFSSVGEILGKKRKSIAKLNMGNYRKDAMAWNGTAQRYLVEVIPSYLAKIEAGVTKNPERYYNEKRGHFQSIDETKRDFKKKMSSAYEFGMQDFTTELNETLATNNIRGKEAALIRERFNNAIKTAVYSPNSTRGKHTANTQKLIRGSLHGKVDEGSINDLIMQVNEKINDTVEGLSDLIENMDTSYRHLFNQRAKMNLDEYRGGSIANRNKYSLTGELMEDLEGDDLLLAERRLHHSKKREKQERAALRARLLYGKNWRNNPRAKELYKKMTRKNKSSSITDKLVSAIYGVSSGAGVNVSEDELSSLIGLYEDEENKRRTAATSASSSRTTQTHSNSTASTRKISSSSTSTLVDSNVSASGGFGWNAVAQRTLTDIIPSKLDKIERAISKLGSTGGYTTYQHNASGQSSHTHPTGGSGKFDLLSYKEAMNAPLNVLERRFKKTQRDLNGNSKGNEIGPTSAENKSSADIIADRLNENESSLRDLVRSTNDNFMAPMVGGIFGKNGVIRSFFSKDNIKSIRNKLFDEKDGIFKNVGSWFKDQMDYIKYVFTGKGYTNRKGESFKENKNSVFDHIANGYDWVYTKTMQHIFGNDYKKNENYQKFFKRFDFKSKREEKRNKRLAQSGEFKLNENKVAEDPKEIDNRIKELKEKLNNGTLGEAAAKKARIELNNLYHKRKNIAKASKSGKNNSITADIQEAGMSTAQNIRQAGNKLVQNIIGDTSDSAIKKDKKDFIGKYKSTFKKFLPVGIAGAIVGGGAGALMSLQGGGAVAPLFFSGGPIAGAVLGVSATILARSEKFQKAIFGEKGEDGNRRGGLISQKTQNFFKKNAPLLVGGATIGALKGVFKTAVGGSVVGGPGGFLLNSLLPGGIIGGAMLGLGISMLKGNERFTNILFGKKKEKDDKRQTKSIGEKLSHAFSKSGHFIKGGLKGLGIGAGTGVALSSMGVIGGAMSLGGPVGMGLAGLGLGIASQADRVKRMLFGEEEFDEEGKSKGRRKNGLFPRMRNYLVMNVFEPLKDNLQAKTEDFAFWLKKKITYPFRLAFGPIFDSFREIRKNISDTIKHTFENLADTIGKTVKTTLGIAFKPVTAAFKRVGTTVTNVAFAGAKLAISPLTVPLSLLQFGTRNLRKKAMGERTKSLFQHVGDIYKGVKQTTLNEWNNDERDYGHGILGDINKFFTRGRDVFRNTREGIDAAKAAYNEGMKQQGFNTFNWMNVKDEIRHDKEARKQLKGERKSWKKINEVRRDIAKENNHSEIFASADQLDRYKKQLKDSGFKFTDLIQTSSDLNDFLYNKDDFMERIKNGDRNKIKDSTATEKFYATTYDYQKHVMQKFDFITKQFMKYATQDAIKRRKNLSIQNLSDIEKNLSEAGLTWDDIGIEPGYLAKVSSISDEDFNTYMNDRLNPDTEDNASFNSLVRDILQRQNDQLEQSGERDGHLIH